MLGSTADTFFASVPRSFLKKLTMSVAFPQVQLDPGAMPVVVASGADGQTAHFCVVSPQVQFLDEVVQISCRGAGVYSHGLLFRRP